jgi:hypothetical protein
MASSLLQASFLGPLSDGEDKDKVKEQLACRDPLDQV